MKWIRIICGMLVVASLSGCMLPSQRTIGQRTEHEMDSLMLKDVHFFQTDTIALLDFLSASAKKAGASFCLDYSAVRNASLEAEQTWVLTRKQDVRPPPHSVWYTGWEPAAPNPGFCTTACLVQNGTNAISFHDALLILCQTTGLQWEVVNDKVVVRVNKKTK
jgi:hypothetical protein